MGKGAVSCIDIGQGTDSSEGGRVLFKEIWEKGINYFVICKS